MWIIYLNISFPIVTIWNKYCGFPINGTVWWHRKPGGRRQRGQYKPGGLQQPQLEPWRRPCMCWRRRWQGGRRLQEQHKLRGRLRMSRRRGRLRMMRLRERRGSQPMRRRRREAEEPVKQVDVINPLKTKWKYFSIQCYRCLKEIWFLEGSQASPVCPSGNSSI